MLSFSIVLVCVCFFSSPILGKRLMQRWSEGKENAIKTVDNRSSLHTFGYTIVPMMASVLNISCQLTPQERTLSRPA